MQAILPIGPMPKDILEEYVEVFQKHRHVRNFLDPQSCLPGPPPLGLQAASKAVVRMVIGTGLGTGLHSMAYSVYTVCTLKFKALPYRSL